MKVESYNPNATNPVTFTDSAIAHLAKQVENQSAKGILFNVREAGCSGYKYLLELAFEIEQSALSFELNKEYEELVGVEFRSHEVFVLSPKLNDEFIDQKVKFSFKGLYDQQYRIKVFDNQENIVLEKKLNSNYFLEAEIKETGVYYWRLENDEDIFRIRILN